MYSNCPHSHALRVPSPPPASLRLARLPTLTEDQYSLCLLSPQTWQILPESVPSLLFEAESWEARTPYKDIKTPRIGGWRGVEKRPQEITQKRSSYTLSGRMTSISSESTWVCPTLPLEPPPPHPTASPEF